MRRRLLLLVSAFCALPAAASAAEGFAVCVAIDDGGQGRLAQTAQPYARDSARVDADSVAFVRAAVAAGLAGSPAPACHWEPTRAKAADYLRRLKEGAGKRGGDALMVAFSPSN